MKIFLSYGHDTSSDLAIKLKKELEKIGFKVWMDQNEIKTTQDWEISIERGIESSDWVVVLMTPHSMRRPEGVCLDEVSYARYRNKNIAPIMVQMVQPPLTIARIQWLDMQDCKDKVTGEINEDTFSEKFDLLLQAINGKFRLGFEGEITDLNRQLKPIDNSVEIYHHAYNFVGRKSLLKQYNDWLHNFNSKIFWITGEPGAGKTALSSYLCYSDPTISCYHFFKFKDSDRNNAKKAICSIVYYLATQIPEYLNNIINLPDLKNLEEKSISALFKYLIVNPLNGIHITEKKKVILFDAIDEIDPSDRNDFMNTIVQSSELLPNWLGIVVTSRPDPEIKRRLSKFKPYEFELNSDENKNDILSYIKKRDTNKKIPQNSMSDIEIKSQGNFLFVKEFMDQIESGNISIDDIEQLPKGLSSLYSFYFDRQFTQYDIYKSSIRPLLEVICAVNKNLTLDQVNQILNWDEYELEDVFEELGSLFIMEPILNPEEAQRDIDFYKGIYGNNGSILEDLIKRIKKEMNTNIIRPFHKSIIDYLLSKEDSGKYRVSLKKGHERIFDAFWSKYQNEGTLGLTTEQGEMLIHSMKELNKWSEIETFLCDPSLILDLDNPCSKLQWNYDLIDLFPEKYNLDSLKDLPKQLITMGWEHIRYAGSLEQTKKAIRYFYRAFGMMHRLKDPKKVKWVLELIGTEGPSVCGFIASGSASWVTGIENDVYRPEIRRYCMEMLDYLKKHHIDVPEKVESRVNYMVNNFSYN